MTLDAKPSTQQPPSSVPFRVALRFWLKLGFISFGGPAGQIAIMHAELVERRRWISERRFLHALNYCMLLPGPEAQQLATYLGWLMHRTWGGVAAGVLFVLPSFFILTALSWAYVRFGQTPWLSAVLWGLKPAVVALVVHAGWRLGLRTLRTMAAGAIALGAFVAMTFDLPFPAILLGASLAGLALPGRFIRPDGSHASRVASGDAPRALIDDDTAPPPHARFSRRRALALIATFVAIGLVALMLIFMTDGVHGRLAQIASFFTRVAFLTFGGAYAVLPYVTEMTVERYGWLTTAQMIDGLALGETTPGPLIMVNAFVGYVAAYARGHHEATAIAGAGVATFFTFLPSFLFILVGAPWVESSRSVPVVQAPLTAISAAVVGVIATLGVFFASHVFVTPHGPDLAAVALAALAFAVLVGQRASVVTVVCGCALFGVVRMAFNG
ncbi:MAG TPA: chromate efflux transporter [Burkholderiaceae bacterium]|nr:chromate efflux transporter [Burkholderiaceae bacterium]